MMSKYRYTETGIVVPGLTGAPTARQLAAADGAPRVVVLAGGLSHERDVSLRSGRRVTELLRSVGCDVTQHDVDSSLIDFLAAAQPDVIWPLLHGAGGEDGSLRDILELIGIPYVGTAPRAARLAWDKPIVKERLADSGINTPDWVTLPADLFRDLGAMTVVREIINQFGLPVVVKPTRGGSALGVTRVDYPEEFSRAMVTCFAYCDSALIERAINGTELAVAVIETDDGPVALPPVEIVVDSGPYDYDARYNAGRVEYFTPARLSPELLQKVCDMAIKCHQVLDLRDLSRTDLIVQADGTIQVLEVNVAPGMTETSLVPQAVTAAGFRLADVYRDLVTRVAARSVLAE
jgi:D-alanine-D-alanine ligase